MRLGLSIVIILLLLASVFSSFYLNYHIVLGDDNCILMYALAVKDEKEGMLIPFRICIEASSTNKIIIYSHGSIAKDVIASFVISSLITQLELGQNRNYTISIEILSNESAKGPSAGALIAVALTSLIVKESINGSITGFINIDGGIDAIGGLIPKVKVAIKNNITRIAIPVFNYLESVYGLKLLLDNAIVEPVASIIDSYEFLAKREMVKNYTLLRCNPLINESFFNISLNLEKLTKNILNKLENKVDTSEITKYLSYAELFRKNGKTYIAASMAFISYIRALESLCNIEGYEHIKKLKEKTRSIINETLNILKNLNMNTDISFILGIEVLRRLADANTMLAEAEKASSAKEIYSITAYAYARALSAKQWLQVLENVIRSSIGRNIRNNLWFLELEKFANYTIDSVSEIITLEELKIPSIIQKAPRNKELLWKAALARYVIDTISSMVRASSFRSIEKTLPYLKDKLLKTFIINVSKALELRLSKLQRIGVDVTIPMFYLDYSNDVISIGFYEAAITSLIHAAGVTLTLEFMHSLAHIPEVELEFEQSRTAGLVNLEEIRLPTIVLLTIVLTGEAICTVYLILIFSRR